MVENMENIPENIGNYLCEYFYYYIISILNKEDYKTNKKSDSVVLKYLPETISFNQKLYDELMKNNISLENIKNTCDNCLWYCDKEWVLILWQIMKPTIHDILEDSIIKSNMSIKIDKPIIHFRCADTPFIKHEQYFFQRYEFFKKSLENTNSKEVILKSNSTHNSKNEEQKSCYEYTIKLKEYLEKIGYNCVVESKTNIEDFVDMFYSPLVISPGSSFSFMSGFFGNAKFISTEHCKENNECVNYNDDVFITGYNIQHKQIDSYYDIDKVYSYLIL